MVIKVRRMVTFGEEKEADEKQEVTGKGHRVGSFWVLIVIYFLTCLVVTKMSSLGGNSLSCVPMICALFCMYVIVR